MQRNQLGGMASMAIQPRSLWACSRHSTSHWQQRWQATGLHTDHTRVHQLSPCDTQRAMAHHGATRGIVLLHTPSNPLAVHRVLAAEAFDVGRPTGRIGGQGPLQGGNHLRRFAHALGV